MHDHQGGEKFELVLRALPSAAPPAVRLRQVLKALLRHYDFRCESVTDRTPWPPGAGPRPDSAGAPPEAGAEVTP